MMKALVRGRQKLLCDGNENAAGIALVDFLMVAKNCTVYLVALLDERIDPSMTDKPVRPQLNIRLDKHPELLDDIKQAASDRNITASEFVIDAILTVLGKPTTSTPTTEPSLESIKAEIDELIDAKLDKRLGEFEQRFLAQFRRNDRQPPPEEDRQVAEEVRPETRPDYQAIRDRILKSLITGRGRIAMSAPQYKTATKVLDRFITEIQADAKTPPKA